MSGLTKDIRLQIYNDISHIGDIWGKCHTRDALNKADFLNKIWPLHLMTSSDLRYSNAYEDATKHLVDNEDWDDDYTFLDRFKLLDCSEAEFIKFINAVISPTIRINQQEISEYARAIDRTLPRGYVFKDTVDDYGNQALTLIAQKTSDEYEYPINLQKNRVCFFVNKKPTSFPSFLLRSDNWDDYGFKTRFTLYYNASSDKSKSLGVIKIFKENESTTVDVIPPTFTILPDSFCSLMQSKKGYELLTRIRKEDYISILYALRDAAYFPEISERYENMQCFRISLLRNYETSDILTNVKREIELEGNLNDWSFGFNTELPYSIDPVCISFNFGNLCDTDNINRIKALIGPNGAGKTTVLKSLVNKLIRGETDGFKPYPPMFNKIITISFSIFDTFINLRGKSVLTYAYCGLHDTENSIMSEDDRAARLREALKWITKSKTNDNGNLLKKFMSALKIFFQQEWVDAICTKDGLRIDMIIKNSQQMSSGESMILNLVASLYANIRKNSLIVFDELEVHLHPRAIRQMMSLLFRITREFESACIIATHSSIVIQELMADNVTIIEKKPLQSETASPIWNAETRCLNRESLAENLSAVSDEIFGESSIQPHYKLIINECAKYANSLEDLLNDMTSDGLTPSLHLYMIAREAFENFHRK
jgi:ABC-type multidrug transport system ATPase subunit